MNNWEKEGQRGQRVMKDQRQWIRRVKNDNVQNKKWSKRSSFIKAETGWNCRAPLVMAGAMSIPPSSRLVRWVPSWEDWSWWTGLTPDRMQECLQLYSTWVCDVRLVFEVQLDLSWRYQLGLGLSRDCRIIYYLHYTNSQSSAELIYILLHDGSKDDIIWLTEGQPQLIRISQCCYFDMARSIGIYIKPMHVAAPGGIATLSEHVTEV